MKKLKIIDLVDETFQYKNYEISLSFPSRKFYIKRQIDRTWTRREVKHYAKLKLITLYLIRQLK